MNPQAGIALSPDEVVEITGYRHTARQIEALVFMDIPFRLRPNGSVYVPRATAVNFQEDAAPRPAPIAIVNPV